MSDKTVSVEKCIVCKEFFVFGKNVFTDEGIAETQISGMCESCFDETCNEIEDWYDGNVSNDKNS
jgi:hypothetical protein